MNYIYTILFLAENFRFVTSYVGRGGIWSLTHRDEGSDPAGEGSEKWDQGSESPGSGIRGVGSGMRESPGSGIRGVGSGIRIPRVRDQRGGIRDEGMREPPGSGIRGVGSGTRDDQGLGALESGFRWLGSVIRGMGSGSEATVP